MSKYSIDGYIINIKNFRSGKTLLVEGPSDRLILSQLDIKVRCEESPPLIIDTPDIFQVDTPAIGNRERVELVHGKLLDADTTFAALVDREYRDFDIENTLLDSLGRHQVVNGTLFWTRGHSIENYLFTYDRILGCMHDLYAEQLNFDLRTELLTVFNSLVFESTIFSVAACRLKYLGRFEGIPTRNFWKKCDGQWQLNRDNILIDIKSRGLTSNEGGEFLSLCDTLRPIVTQICINEQRWIIHGHLGFSLLWSGVAALLALHGANTALTQQIAHGDQKMKLRRGAAIWAEAFSLPLDSDEVPEQLIAWIKH